MLIMQHLRHWLLYKQPLLAWHKERGGHQHLLRNMYYLHGGSAILLHSLLSGLSVSCRYQQCVLHMHFVRHWKLLLDSLLKGLCVRCRCCRRLLNLPLELRCRLLLQHRVHRRIRLRRGH